MFALMCSTIDLFRPGTLWHYFIRNLLLEAKLFFPEDLWSNFTYFFDDNKFPVEIKSYSYNNIR